MKYKTKILIISQGFWPEHFPINEFVKTLSTEKDLEISVLTGFPNYPEGKIFRGYEKNYLKKIFDKNPAGYNIFRIPIIRRVKNSKISIVFNYLSFIFVGVLLSPFLLRKKKFDYILVFANSPVPQAFIGIFLKLIKNSKLIIWVQDLWPEILKETGYVKNKFFLGIINFFIKIIYYCSDIILAQSKSFQREIRKKTNRKIVYFPNPSIDMSKLFQSKFKDKKGPFKILYAGNIGEAQNFEKLIEVAKISRKEKIIFQIIGGGNKYSWIKKKIKDEKIKNIHLLNNIDFKKIPKYYSNADCLLISLKNYKYLNMTIPSKLQNYLSARKPILSMCGGETKKIIIENNCGLDLNNMNNKNISKKIVTFSKKKKSSLKLMASRGYKFFKKNFTINETKKQFYQIIGNEKI